MGTSTRTCSKYLSARRSICATPSNFSIPIRSTMSTRAKYPDLPLDPARPDVGRRGWRPFGIPSMMAIFQWFDTEEIDEFAQSIAAELVKRAPPAGLDAHDEKTSKRLRNTHHAVFSRAEQFARTHKLNIYKKARLGNQFRWALKEAGYPKAFVETWTYELITLVALRSTAPRDPGR